jgi:selenocysteine lyase/cysteine desulfurase
VKSEFELRGLRIDTLAFYNESKAFVIIEYKKDRNFSVVDQGMAYLNLMLNNKADFILEYKIEEINKISRGILIRTKDIVQELGYELVYADTDSIFIKKKGATAASTIKTIADHEQVVDILSKETGLSIQLIIITSF